MPINPSKYVGMDTPPEIPKQPTVPKHLNFITGNKNKLAEVRITLSHQAF
jgi:hypothetical protein